MKWDELTENKLMEHKMMEEKKNGKVSKIGKTDKMEYCT